MLKHKPLSSSSLSLSLLSIGLAVAGIAACSSIESTDLETDGMRPIIVVNAAKDGSSTTVNATIGAGTLTTVDLDGSDVLTATSGDVSVDLDENALLGVYNYSGTLDGVGAPDDVVTVALTRAEGKESAPSSTVSIPEPVDFAAPAAGASFSRTADIVVELQTAASDDDVTVSWTGDCIDTGSVTVPAGQNSVTIAAGTIVEQLDEEGGEGEGEGEGEAPTGTCQITLQATRSRAGTLDPAFGGGAITAQSVATRDVTSTR
jgi:hypothetical protein